jgi:hypothetical protein
MGRDAVRGASAVSRRGPLRPPRGDVNNAGMDNEAAGATLAAHRSQRLGARADHMMKKPSTARACTVLLRNLRSSSSPPSVGSCSSWRADRTIEVVMSD